MKQYIGIDLGTTNSAICSFDGKETRIWKSPEQSDVTPSVIYIDRRGHQFFGRKAFELASGKEENAALLFKRYMGTGKVFHLKDSGVSLTPVECSAMLLKTLFGYLPEEIRNDPETAVVITVPAAFNQMKKDATLEAARMAGIGRIALMQEPVAAVMSVLKKDDREKLFMIYDLGGGTFDVSVARFVGGHVSLLSQGGREMMGGRDMDRWIYTHKILPWLKKSFRLPGDPDAQEKYLKMKRSALFAAEEAKIALSSVPQTQIWMDEGTLQTTDEDGREMYLELTLTREDLQPMIEEMAEESAGLARETIRRAGIPESAVDQIVFVGGPSMYTPLREAVCAKLGIDRGTAVNPRTAVSEGAAIYAETINWENDQFRKKDHIGEETIAGTDPAGRMADPEKRETDESAGGGHAAGSGNREGAGSGHGASGYGGSGHAGSGGSGYGGSGYDGSGGSGYGGSGYDGSGRGGYAGSGEGSGGGHESGRNGGTDITVTIRYEKRTSLSSGKIGVIFSDDQPRTVVLERKAGTGENGDRICSETIRRSGLLSVPLPGPGEYRFLLRFPGADGKDLLPSREVNMTRVLASIEAIPASHSIAVKALNKPGGVPVPVYLVKVNEPLPKSGTLSFRAAIRLVGGSEGALTFSLWEGEIQEPIEDNRYIGTFRIPGTSIQGGVVTVGTEVICNYEMNEAGNLRLGVSIPSVGLQMEEENFYSRYEGQLDFEDTLSLVKETNRLLDRTAQMKMRIVDESLDQVRRTLLEIRQVFSSGTDQEMIIQAESRLRECYRKVAELHIRYANLIRSFDLDRVMEDFEKEKAKATQEEMAAFLNLVEGARYSIDLGSSDFDQQIRELRGVIAHIRWRQDDYIRQLFHMLTLLSGAYTDQSAFEQLRAAGQTCMENGQMDQLRVIVNEMAGLLKPDPEQSVEHMLDEVGIYV